MVIFDLRTDGSHDGFIAAVNRGLDSESGNPYLVRYGHIGSDRWWSSIDRNELPVEVLSGKVTFVGLRLEEWTNEEEDVVEFVVDGQVFGYDRVGPWTSVPIRVGDILNLTRTIAEVHTWTGPVIYVIDIRCEWLPTSEG